MAKQTNKELALKVLELVGGEKNVKHVVHCATRLRFNLKDETIADTEGLTNMEGVIQVVQSGGQYQVVIGSHVRDVYQELIDATQLGEETDSEGGKDEKNVFNKFVDIISSVFTPFLGALAGIGVLKGFLTLATVTNLISVESGTYQIFLAASDGFMQFLPMALAFTAAKKFKADPFISLAIASALLYPAITANATTGLLNFFGLPVVMGPTGYMQTVIPIILFVWVQSYVEKVARKISPNFLQVISVPVLTILVMVPLTFVVIGPIGTIFGNILGKGYDAIFGFSPIVAGLVMGSLWQVFVMFGMHWGFIPIALNNLTVSGYDTMAPMLLGAVLAQAGASLAVSLRTKNEKRKALAATGALTAVFGITEPTVYGVTLPLRKPFIAACIGGGVGGAIIGGAGVKSFAGGLISVLSIPTFISPIEGVESNVVVGIIGIIVSIVLAFVLTLVLGFDTEDQSKKNDETKVDENASKEDDFISAPLTGKIVALKDVPDEVFASEALGKGIAIEPTVGELRSPVKGKVTTVFPTGHAVGVTSDSGVEVLMHIGMDTVSLKGEGFSIKVTDGQEVEKGTLLVTMDLDFIRDKGLPTITPIVITNTADYLDILDLDQTDVVMGEDILTVVK